MTFSRDRERERERRERERREEKRKKEKIIKHISGQIKTRGQSVMKTQ